MKRATSTVLLTGFEPFGDDPDPGAPSIPVETVAEALRVALRAAINTGDDVRIAAGREH